MSPAKRPKIAVCVTSLAAKEAELGAIKENMSNLRRFFNVKLYEDITKNDLFDSQSVSRRIRNFNRAARDADIIMAWNGGFNSIELLAAFNRIKVSKDKVFIGYSDNTILVNALPAKDMCRGWQGPMISSWLKYPQYDEIWSESLYALYTDDYKKLSELYNSFGYKVYRPGLMKGKIWGGNNYTFDLLQGTEYCPAFQEPYILLLEGEDFIVAKDRIWQDFIRNLDSILLLPGAKENIQGLLVGRFPNSYKLNETELKESFRRRKALQTIPIIYDFPRGYYMPSLFLPIGEKLEITISRNNDLRINKL